MRTPSLLVPYPGPDSSGNTFDSYVYLRPETNGVVTESVIMKTILGNERWKNQVKLVYMANYPGDYIQTRHLIEHHYRLKLYFAEKGGRGFTPGMRREFEEKFAVEFDSDKVIGAFGALEKFGLDEESLFRYRVEAQDMLVSLGQNIKRYEDEWIVNYDIPAILHKNTFETDIAVMVFRSGLAWDDYRELIEEMSRHLVDAGVVAKDSAPSRAFHHSKSPWEQLLDGIDFLWGVDVSDGGAEDDISFGAYMMKQGHSREALKEAISHPLVVAAGSDGRPREENIIEASAGMDYRTAEEAWKRTIKIIRLPGD